MNIEQRLKIELRIENANKKIKQLDKLLSKINEEIINGYIPFFEMEDNLNQICEIGNRVKDEIEVLQRLKTNSYQID